MISTKDSVSVYQSLSDFMLYAISTGPSLIYAPFKVCLQTIGPSLDYMRENAFDSGKTLEAAHSSLYQKLITIVGIGKNYLFTTLRVNEKDRDQNLMKYNAERVNALLHIDDSRELKLDNQAHECGSILIEHGVEDHIAITRLHHHYKLENNERVVLTIEDASVSRSKGTAQSKGSIIVKVPRAEEPGDIPYIFGFDNNGVIIPLEYISSNASTKVLASIVEKRLKTILSNQTYIKALFEKIQAQGNLENFGFQAIFENDVLPLPEEEGLELHEDNWPKYQEVSYRRFVTGQDATITSWRFSKGPKQSRCHCVARMYCQWTGQSHMSLCDGHNQYD